MKIQFTYTETIPLLNKKCPKIEDLPEKTFPQIVYKYRKAHKLTQKELADILNVSEATIYLWEKGYKKPDRLDHYKFFHGEHIYFNQPEYIFTDLVCLYRKEKKLTQKEMADYLGVNFKSISKWENKKCLPIKRIVDECMPKLKIANP